MPASSPVTKTVRKSKPRTFDMSALAIRAQLADILASPEFSRSDRLCRFLRLTVDWTLAGRAGKLKEYVLGKDVFDRGSGYDPSSDSIVRVEARRLRTKLRRYYEAHNTAEVLIEFPSGSYVPVFRKLTPAAAEQREVPAAHNVAVLPFANLGPEPDQDFLCDGITEAILHKLATIPTLRVVARTSAYRFKGKTGDVRKIGQILRAGTIVEGSVRNFDDHLRVSALAIKVADGYSIWSGTFDRKIEDVFVIQDEIASAVAAALHQRLGPAAATKIVNLGAYKLYLSGRHHWDHGEFELAISDFRRANLLFPDYAPAFAGLADAYTWLWFVGLARPGEVVPKARQAASEALRLDPQPAAAYVSLGALTCWHDWNWDKGADLLRKAIELEPSSVMALTYYGAQFVIRGAFADGMVFLQKALRLDPLSVQTHMLLGWACYVQRKFDEAIDWLKKGLKLREGWRLRVLLGWAYLRKLHFEEAIEEFRKSSSQKSTAFALSGLAEAYACWGKADEAHSLLRQLDTLSQTTYVPATSYVYVYLALGEMDEAFSWMERACQEHATTLPLSTKDKRYDPVRSDPRWKSIVTRLGLATEHRSALA